MGNEAANRHTSVHKKLQQSLHDGGLAYLGQAFQKETDRMECG